MAKSRSTSDTCSKCGQRIDKCVPPCPVAVSLKKEIAVGVTAITISLTLRGIMDLAEVKDVLQVPLKGFVEEILDDEGIDVTVTGLEVARRI